MSVSAGVYSTQLLTPVSSSINGSGVYPNLNGGPTQSNSGDPAFFIELVDTQPGFDGSFPVVPPIYAGTQRNFAWITGVRAFASNDFTVTYAVPEPVTLVLAAAAGALLLARAARRPSP